MRLVEIYAEDEFKTNHNDIYTKVIEEANRIKIDLNSYYFSQYLVSSYATNKMFGEVLYLLDDGIDDTSFYLEIIFDENGQIEDFHSLVSRD